MSQSKVAVAAATVAAPKDIKVTKVDDTTCKVEMVTKNAQCAMYEATNYQFEQFPAGGIMNNDQLHKILAWAVSWNLSMDSDVSIIIPRKDCRQ